MRLNRCFCGGFSFASRVVHVQRWSAFPHFEPLASGIWLLAGKNCHLDIMWPWISQWTCVLCRGNPRYLENSFISFACSPVVRQASVASVYNLALMLLKNSAKITTSVSFCFICSFSVVVFLSCAGYIQRSIGNKRLRLILFGSRLSLSNSVQLTGDFRDLFCDGDANEF